MSALDQFSPMAQEWFRGAFASPTAAQEGAWQSIARGDNTLVVAPTGSGKTLAAFFWSLDRLAVRHRQAEPERRAVRQARSARKAEPEQPKSCRVLYISPLKALAVDVERNLRAPLAGLKQTARRLGLPVPEISVAIRSGDTSAEERRRFASKPSDILITTPESLFLLLTSQAREALRGVETVIIDEVHAVAATKRGAHLALSLERLDDLLERPAQRIGLSATVRPVSEVAAFLGGTRPATVVQPPSDKQIEIEVVVPIEDMTELDAPPPQDDFAEPARRSIWPHVEDKLFDLIGAHSSTIVFANSRRLAERLCTRLNELAYERSNPTVDLSLWDSTGGGEQHVEVSGPGARRSPAEMMAQAGGTKGVVPEVVRAHHGSVSKEERSQIEEALKSGRLPAVVATSSLELGIDMGAVDLVACVEAPPSVASGLQRIGRAGHQVGAVSRGVIFPKYRGDLIQTAVVAERMKSGQIEEMRYPRNPLDVLAQQIVAMTALDEWTVDSLETVIKRAAPYSTLPRSALEATLDMLAGRYPSEEFAELRPRIVWDRVTGTLQGRPGTQRLAVTNGGTIPDRGLFGVFLVGERASRVGELDEEMVYESRAGDVFVLGATSWRIEDITADRVLVSPAPGQPGKLPFWHGDTLGRPAELGRAIGAFLRDLSAEAEGRTASPEPSGGRGGSKGSKATGKRRSSKGADVAGSAVGGSAVVGSGVAGSGAAGSGAAGSGAAGSGAAGSGGGAVERLRAAGLDGYAVDNLLSYLHEQREATGYVPDDRTLLVERFHDELGDWRVVIHSPYGARVHAPWALAINRRLRERYGLDVQAVHSDDGIVLRIPDTLSDPPTDVAAFDPEEIGQIVTEELGGSALFASRFRECAGRALLLPRRNPGRRTPLWQQRQRAAHLLGVASQYASFPVVLETMRECLQDVFDVPGLVQLMRDIAARRVRVVEVETSQASPFAASLLFHYIGAFMYEGDAPLAERRAQALALDTSLLAELLGQADLRELLDPDVIADSERELARLDRPLRDQEDLADLLRSHGPLLADDVSVRGGDPAWLAELERARRAIRVRVAGEEQWAAIEDAARLRDALGTPLPVGIPHTFLEPVADPLSDLLSRHARTRGPFTAGTAAARFGLGVAVVTDALNRLAATGRVVQGEFRPGGRGEEWCDAGVLRMLRRRSLARLRKEVEPVAPETLATFLPAWHGITASIYQDGEGHGGAPGYGAQGVSAPGGHGTPGVSGPTGHGAGGHGAGNHGAGNHGAGGQGAGAFPGAGGRGGSGVPGSGGHGAWGVSGPGADRRGGGASPARAMDALVNALEQLQGAAIPASALENLVLPARVPGYHPALLDELTASGEVLWAGQGSLPGGDGWVSLYFADTAPLLMPDPLDVTMTPLHERVLEVLGNGGALFFRGLSERAGALDDSALVAALWDLVWSGRVSGDTLAPLRATLGTGRPAHRPATTRRRRAVLPTRSGPPTVAGRWWLLPSPSAEPTVRAQAQAEVLLERHGVITRGAVAAERLPGGFSGVYQVLRAFEESGRCRRGYFVEGLGGAQFALPGAVDRMRALAPRASGGSPPAWGAPGEGPQAPSSLASAPGRPVGERAPEVRRAVVLAATDPANPYGAALPWPAHPGDVSHKPGRKAGALVVLIDGFLVLYVERGGKTLLSFADDERLQPAVDALALAVRDGVLGKLTVERADGESIIDSPLAGALEAAGFHPTPRGLRLRA
ncbi:Lhr family helicase [Nonomuraea soli]|uniref:ATP-dependent Lhr-like helicase n=1 Tax=Nonomuraea soli TaxID=1032476 RepID=A0A7W0CD46_9ACTN|nr:DEAD/DEAH box helicase [Nonomuraea soli]MBA2888963.1 ATP-dependent Lhr-like helicase [Nonomuraea soli]